MLPRAASSCTCARGWAFSYAVAQAGGADVRVDLRGHQALVAQQFLHAADVGAAVEQVRGEAVPQRVRRGAAVEAGLTRGTSPASGPTLRVVSRRPNLLTNTGAVGPAGSRGLSLRTARSQRRRARMA